MKRLFKTFILILLSLTVYSQETKTVSKESDKSARYYNLTEILPDSIKKSQLITMFRKKVNDKPLLNAFGDRLGYYVKIYFLSTVNCDEQKCELKVDSLMFSGTEFVDLEIKAKFEQELKDYYTSLSSFIDKEKVKNIASKKIIYYTSVRICR